MRNLIFAILVLLALVFVFLNRGEVQGIAETLQRSDWRFILLGFGLQAIWTFNHAAIFLAIYKSLNLRETIERMYLMVLGANFVNVVAPSVGVGGLALFISQGRRNGDPAARVTVAGALVVFFDYISLLFVLALGLIVLFRRNNLDLTEIAASSVLLILAIIFGVFFYLGMRSERAMGRSLAWLARQVNRFLFLFMQRNYLSEKHAFKFAREASTGLKELRKKPKRLLLPVTLSLVNKVILIAILMLVFMAFEVPFSIGTLIAGFSIGYLFYIVSPTPAGIGVVEGALTLGLRSLNVPLGTATVIALAYRGIIFWIPLIFGMLAFRWLTHSEQTPIPTKAEMGFEIPKRSH
jgi:uncharacterized protein (TIRG00374 family)